MPASPLPPAVWVRLFGPLRQAAGWDERWVPTDGEPITPLVLWRQLGLAALAGSAEVGRPGAGDGLPGGVRVAINQQFASPQAPLAAGDELAFLPPITGG